MFNRTLLNWIPLKYSVMKHNLLIILCYVGFGSFKTTLTRNLLEVIKKEKFWTGVPKAQFFNKLHFCGIT